MRALAQAPAYTLEQRRSREVNMVFVLLTSRLGGFYKETKNWKWDCTAVR